MRPMHTESLLQEDAVAKPCVICGCPECDHPGFLAIGPCDSYRTEFDMRVATLHDAKMKLRRIVDEPIFELLTPSEALSVLEALDA